MTEKKHINYGLNGIRSETAGGWSASQHYIDREPGQYVTPGSMVAPCNAKEIPQPKQMRRKTTTKDKAVKAANQKDLKEKGIN